MSENQVFYPRLQKLVQLSKKSFNQVERDLGYPRNSLNNYKYGNGPSGVRLIEVANYFKVAPEYLVGLSNSPKSYSVSEVFDKLDDQQKKDLCVICQNWLLNL